MCEGHVQEGYTMWVEKAWLRCLPWSRLCQKRPCQAGSILQPTVLQITRNYKQGAQSKHKRKCYLLVRFTSITGSQKPWGTKRETTAAVRNGTRLKNGHRGLEPCEDKKIIFPSPP